MEYFTFFFEKGPGSQFSITATDWSQNNCHILQPYMILKIYEQRLNQNSALSLKGVQVQQGSQQSWENMGIFKFSGKWSWNCLHNTFYFFSKPFAFVLKICVMWCRFKCIYAGKALLVAILEGFTSWCLGYKLVEEHRHEDALLWSGTGTGSWWWTVTSMLALLAKHNSGYYEKIMLCKLNRS